MMMKRIMGVLLLLMLLAMAATAAAAGQETGTAAAGTAGTAVRGKLLFIPHDNRPISKDETAEVVQKLGYDVVMPPDEILSSGVDRFGQVDKLWDWMNSHLNNVDAAMVSTDAMIYGGLVPSRNHELSKDELMQRVQRFEAVRKAHPSLKLYGFGSLMRTPHDGASAGSEEPAYYQQYGADIFQATALLDKQELGKLTPAEQQALQQHQSAIPAKDWQDWMNRREKNLAVSKTLIDQVRHGVFSYFVIGKDDNAPLSQTHREGRALEAYAKGVPETQFQLLAGIDEFGLLLLSRAVNDHERQIPFVYVAYNSGVGADTVPGYSDTRIGSTIRSSILVAGGLPVMDPAKADFVLLVNTNQDGKTADSNGATQTGIANNGVDRVNTQHFVRMVNDAVAAGYPVGIADIAFSNGSDNALMNRLRDAGLLYKIRAYAGWNTATNSTGFVIGTGLLANRMSGEACDSLLTRRYLEDWGYQSNVRGRVGDSIYQFREEDIYSNLGRYETGVVYRINSLMRQFAQSNLPPYPELENLKVSLPWHRMFEARFTY